MGEQRSLLECFQPLVEFCSLVSRKTHRPHHYRASAPLWIEQQTGINWGKNGKSNAWDQLHVSAGAQLSTYAIQIQKLVCCDRAVPNQVHLYLFLLDVEEVVSDSRWGCSPIRGGLLENDEWGWLREAAKNISRVKMTAAVLPNEYKHTERDLCVLWCITLTRT